jgi:uroporphyrinogen III methyltransferase/synthase
MISDDRLPSNSSGVVYLVGAGPGQLGLLTLRAVECLGRADVVVYDKLVPPRFLEQAPAAAQRICVTSLSDCHAERYLPIQRLLVEEARRGKCVVRLKGGDPFLFGRGGEEAEALRQAGIPFEVVPGVTAALGVSACAGIPLTHRGHASAVAFVTGHENPLKPESALDWQSLARFPGTLVIYMGMSRLPQIAALLMQYGKSEETPSAVVQWGTTGEQRTVEARLRDISASVQAAGLTAPALILIGSVVSLRAQLTWFEQRPLFGKRILVTRPRRQASDLVRRLEELGAVTCLLPAVEIQDPPDWKPVDQALAELPFYHWLVFTSANGVERCLNRLPAIGRDLRALGGIKLAAIGPKTAEALQAYHLQPDLVPKEYRSERLAEELQGRVSGQRVLLARADRGRDVLRQELAKVAEVTQVAVYSQVDALEADPQVLDALRRGEIDYLTVTSSNIARSLIRTLDESCRARLESGVIGLVSISPVTSATLRELGMPVAAEAEVYTAEGIVQALLRLVKDEPPSRARSAAE